LKCALLHNNINEVELAHAMLEGVSTVKKEEEIKKNEADKLQMDLEKKKSKLIYYVSNTKEK